MAKIDLLRQIIREEVTKALRQELPKILSEGVKKETGVKNVIREMKKSEFPITLNTVDTYTKTPSQQYTNSPFMNSLLAETAKTMMNDDYDNFNMTTENVNPVSFFQPKEAAVGDIGGMLTSARPSSEISMVQINEVPDYSHLMKKMLDKGVM
jgi:hypothetical protein